jgi:hypothetical protein
MPFILIGDRANKYQIPVKILLLLQASECREWEERASVTPLEEEAALPLPEEKVQYSFPKE